MSNRFASRLCVWFSCFVILMISTFFIIYLSNHLDMKFLSSFELLNEYTFINQIIDNINKHVAEQNYAIMKERSKTFKKCVFMKFWIHCDRQDEFESQDFEHKKTFNKRVECSFKCIAKLQNNVENEHDLRIWKLIVENAEHNHDFVEFFECVAHRQTKLRKSKIRTKFEKKWRKDSRVNRTFQDLRMNREQSIFKSQNIWIYNKVLKTATLRTLTSTQILLKYLTKFSNWYVDHKKTTTTDVLEYLFFISKNSQTLLIQYYEVLIMNFTYKINKYKISLLIIIEVTFSNIIFYVAFCFMKNENFDDYLWIMNVLIRLFDFFDILYLITTVIDDDKALSSALFRVFAKKNHRVNHILCIWHINQNVIVNCKKYFLTMKEWMTFYERWKIVVYFDIVAKLKDQYNFFHNDYFNAHYAAFEYLKKHLWSTRRKWAKCYTNKILHFENIATSRDERAHHQIKQQLQFFIDKCNDCVFDDINSWVNDDVVDDLYIVINIKLALFLNDQYHNIV